MLLISFIFIYVQFNVDIVVKIVHIIVIMLRASGKIGIANCVLPSLNKDITYLLTYLLTWIIYIYIDNPFLLMLHIKFGFDWPSGFRGDDV